MGTQLPPLPRLAASVCMAVSSAAPDTTLKSMTARCAAPTNTRSGPARADGDTATAASSTSYTRRPSTMLRRSTQLTCTLPRLAASVCMAVSSAAPDTMLKACPPGAPRQQTRDPGQQGRMGTQPPRSAAPAVQGGKHDAKAQYAANMYAAKTGQF